MNISATLPGDQLKSANSKAIDCSKHLSPSLQSGAQKGDFRSGLNPWQVSYLKGPEMNEWASLG